ncbi:MAG TPA: hypothetical protein PLG17_05245 [Thermodesulfobacteriota bacterium]|nr:hypothetical protein [Thermodesulfobacteriota bacterium]HQO77900.1 hypothetical protein [Thermodesulfobacteriota bacterium]
MHHAAIIEGYKFHSEITAIPTGETLPVLARSQLEAGAIKAAEKVPVLSDFVATALGIVLKSQCCCKFNRPKHGTIDRDKEKIIRIISKSALIVIPRRWQIFLTKSEGLTARFLQRLIRNSEHRIPCIPEKTFLQHLDSSVKVYRCWPDSFNTASTAATT